MVSATYKVQRNPRERIPRGFRCLLGSTSCMEDPYLSVWPSDIGKIIPADAFAGTHLKDAYPRSTPREYKPLDFPLGVP